MMTTTDDTRAGSTFPRTAGRAKGYDAAAVDDFLARARRAFEHPDAAASLGAAEVRAMSFPMVRHGYAPDAVDSALARVEDAFAARERDGHVTRGRARAWVDHNRSQAQTILDRLGRDRRRRFDRVGPLRYGYRVDEVDVVADRIAEFLASGRPVTVAQVREVAFRMQRRGYRETQVDAVLDAVVDVMLAVG